MAQILQPTPENLDRLTTALADGEIAAVPTETVYGLAGNALDPQAIARIYEAKGRPARNPLIVHIEDLGQLEQIAQPSELANRLADAFWPGPLTLILPKRPSVPDSVTASLDTVAVRMPAHPIYRQLAERCPFPIAAPSANPFGYVSPTKAEHVKEQMEDKIDWILDGGPCERGIESTILSLADPQQPTLLRHGSISSEQLEDVLGLKIHTPDTRAADKGQNLPSPGLMTRHYSPNTPVNLFEGQAPESSSSSAIVFINSASCSKPNHFALSEDGELEEVARKLYDLLQELDHQSFEGIYMELPKDIGTGTAIRDRMHRAAAR